MKKIFNFKILLLATITCCVLSFMSCDATEDLDPGGTAVEEMAGDWFVKLLADDGTGNLADIYGIGYWRLSTYNTAADVATEMFIDDHGLWPMKAVVSVNIDAKSFSGAEVTSLYDETITAAVSDGLIIPGAATTSGGNPSDSIYLKIEYSDDSGTEYTIAGYKRTGFVEDEH